MHTLKTQWLVPAVNDLEIHVSSSRVIVDLLAPLGLPVYEVLHGACIPSLLHAATAQMSVNTWCSRSCAQAWKPNSSGPAS